MRGLLHLLLAVCTLLLVSCIEGREELWINRDGSGHASLDFDFPTSAARLHGGEDGIRRLIAAILSRTHGLYDSHHEVTTVGNRIHLRVTSSFLSVLDLKNAASDPSSSQLPSAAAGFAGKITLNTRGRSIDFSRTLSPGDSLPASSLLPSSVWNGHLTYILHLPEPATASNATSTADDRRTLIWKIPVATLMREPRSLTFSAPIPIPLWLWPALTAILAGGSLIAIRLFRRRSVR